MVEFTEGEKSQVLHLLEDIARTNREIASHLAIANAEVISLAFGKAFKDDSERRVYELVNGQLSIRQIADNLGIGKTAVHTRLERLASRELIVMNNAERYQKAISDAEIVQRFSKSGEG